MFERLVKVLEERKRSARLLKVVVVPPGEVSPVAVVRLEGWVDGRAVLVSGTGMDMDAAREQAARAFLSKLGVALTGE
jgi:hypothetical protein